MGTDFSCCLPDDVIRRWQSGAPAFEFLRVPRTGAAFSSERLHHALGACEFTPRYFDHQGFATSM